jgi:hypothetical protein
MATLTKADAARQLGISRTTLYKLIDQGTLSATAEGLIDTAELGRVLSTPHVHPARPRTRLDTASMDAALHRDAHRERPADLSSERQPWTSSGRQLTSSLHTSEHQLTSSYRDLVDILREQLQAAQERERDYREHIARLTAMLALQEGTCDETPFKASCFAFSIRNWYLVTKTIQKSCLLASEGGKAAGSCRQGKFPLGARWGGNYLRDNAIKRMG